MTNFFLSLPFARFAGTSSSDSSSSSSVCDDTGGLRFTASRLAAAAADFACKISLHWLHWHLSEYLIKTKYSDNMPVPKVQTQIRLLWINKLICSEFVQFSIKKVLFLLAIPRQNEFSLI